MTNPAKITEVEVSVITSDAKKVSYARILNTVSEVEVRKAILDAGSRMISDAKERDLL